MSPVPDENQNNPSDYDPDKDCEELQTPDIVPPIGETSSSDEADDSETEEDGANGGYMLLPQEPDDGGGGESTVPPLPPSVEASILSDESMTEVRGAGVDMSAAVAQGNIHPAFMGRFPDNKVPVHLQVPDRPRENKEEKLWNQPRLEADRLQLDTAQVSKIKSAMAGFRLPPASIPDWAQKISEDQWKQQLLTCLGTTSVTTSFTVSAARGEGSSGSTSTSSDQAEQKQDQDGKNVGQE